MKNQSVATLGKPSFSCPHCGAVAHQTWYKLTASAFENGKPPSTLDSDFRVKIESAKNVPIELKKSLLDRGEKIMSGFVFFSECDGDYVRTRVENLVISKCYSCKEISVWIYDRLVHPDSSFEVMPNPDIPDDARRDFIEASKILAISPRGSAALLRLCVQKLCKHLGKKGENINHDIAELVRDGLDVRVQQALDIVRVVGNNAVHPGQIDITDDRDTASRLFRLVNMIADATITQPKQIKNLYKELPESAKMQIVKRDGGQNN